jgi:hypothetical protein
MGMERWFLRGINLLEYEVLILPPLVMPIL